MKKRSSLSVPSEPEEDWEKARAWLAHEKVTKMSAKVPGLTDISDEMGLYNYLKDGTELCRVIGLVTRGQVLQGITYRWLKLHDSNNLSCHQHFIGPAIFQLWRKTISASFSTMWKQKPILESKTFLEGKGKKFSADSPTSTLFCLLSPRYQRSWR